MNHKSQFVLKNQRLKQKIDIMKYGTSILKGIFPLEIIRKFFEYYPLQFSKYIKSTFSNLVKAEIKQFK